MSELREGRKVRTFNLSGKQPDLVNHSFIYEAVISMEPSYGGLAPWIKSAQGGRTVLVNMVHVESIEFWPEEDGDG